MLNLNRVTSTRLDIEAIKREHSVTSAAAAAGLKLVRAGSDYKACCPFHADRSPSFTIYGGGKRWCCFGCGEQGDVLDFLRKLHGVGLRDAAAMLTGGDVPECRLPELVADKSDNTPAARAIWEASEPIRGTLAEVYLRSRRLYLVLPDSLRFAALPYGSRGPVHPVMVAAIVDLAGELIGVQRTFLASDGAGKLAVDKPKLSLGRVSGGAARLAPVGGSLVVTEGIEDALTLQQELGLATWAAAGAGMLHKMQFPPEVYSVSVGGDSDEAGRRSAARAYIVAGCPGQLPALASFEDWSRIVRSALVWLGKADPVETMEAARADDPTTSSLRTLLAAWYDAIGPGERTIAKVIAAADERMMGNRVHADLYQALSDVAQARSGEFNSKSLGLWLARHKGRVVDGLKIVVGENKSLKQKTWSVVRASLT